MKRHGCMGIHTDGMSAHETSNGGMSAHETSNGGTSGYDTSTGDMSAQGTRVGDTFAHETSNGGMRVRWEVVGPLNRQHMCFTCGGHSYC